MNTVLITGVSGFLGSYAAVEFAERGWRVVGTHRQEVTAATRALLDASYLLKLPHPEFEPILRTHHPDVLVHCAGGSSVPLSVADSKSDFLAGPVLTFELLDCIRRILPTCRFVYLSSAAVYGQPPALPIPEEQKAQPLSPYGFHKLQSELVCEEFCRIYGVPVSIARIFSAYGPGLRKQVVWDICRKLCSEENPAFQGTGEETRDFLHARDVARGLFILSTRSPMNSERYNLASGQETSIREVVQKIGRQLGFGKKATFDGEVPLGVPANWRADVGRIGQLGFAPRVELANGLAETVQWCQAQLPGLGSQAQNTGTVA